MPRRTPRPHQIHTWQLRNGVTLSIEHIKPIPVEAILDFLGLAMNHFKAIRDKEHATTPAQSSWTSSVIHRGHSIGIGKIASDTALSSDAWVNAVIGAYVVADTASQMKEQLAAYKAQADGWVTEVVAALENNADTDAFELMMKRERENPSL